MSLEARLNDAVLRLARTGPGRAWPAVQLLVGAGALAAAWVVYPGDTGEQLYWFAGEFGGPCGFREHYGVDGPNCGMTRSWVWTARGHLITGLRYNAAGATMFLALVGSGALGAVRLITGDPRRAAVPWYVTLAGLATWFVVLWLGLWLLRCTGWNPLPQ